MSSLSVLVVDDANFIRDLIKKALRANFPKWKIEEAEDGRKAMAALKTRSIDLVLCDWEMPEMSGLDLLQWMRKSEGHSKTPFVMITSRSDRKHVVYAVQEGVNEYIGKPFNNEQLLTKINKVLQRYFKNVASAAPGGAGGMNDSASVLAGAFGGGAAPKKTAAKKGGGATTDATSALISAFGGASAAAPTKAASKKKKPAAAKKTQPAEGASEPSASQSNSRKLSGRSKPKSVATAQLRLSSGVATKCIIKDMDLESLHGVIRREGKLPEICEQAVLDLTKTVEEGDDIVARINGFIASLNAMDNKMDADWIDFEIIYVDDDPEKKEQLTRFIQLTCE
jgi:DNA-binding response OmpR family regulator